MLTSLFIRQEHERPSAGGLQEGGVPGDDVPPPRPGAQGAGQGGQRHGQERARKVTKYFMKVNLSLYDEQGSQVLLHFGFVVLRSQCKISVNKSKCKRT